MNHKRKDLQAIPHRMDALQCFIDRGYWGLELLLEE